MLYLVSPLRRMAWMFLIVFAAGAASAAAAGISADSGVFSITAGKHNAGTEKFKITTTSSGVEVSGELQLEMPGGGNVSETSILKLDPNLKPLSYERQQKSPKKGSLTAQFGLPECKLTSQTDAGNQEQLFYLPDNHLVILDTNFFHHYALLLSQYDTSIPGPQHFNVFIPQEAIPGTISLDLQGKENVEIGKTTRELNHFQAVTDEVKIDIWATPQGEIQRIAIPQANLEIVRQ